MFNFLNSTILFAAAAALIPLIIHLFSKKKVKIIEFSSIRHLKSMQKRQVRRLKIKQLLLLLLRMLIILSVVLAFARPTTEKGSIGSHASVTAIILFDNSASMNRYVTDGNLFDIAKQRTAELIESFGESDEILFLPLASFDNSDFEHHFTSAAIGSGLLRKTNISYNPVDFQKALSVASTKINEAKNLNKEIYFVSDRQRSSLPEESFEFFKEANIYFVDLPIEDNENSGIIEIDLGGQLIIPGHDFTINTKLKNQSNENISDNLVSLIIDNNRIAQQNFSLEGSKENNIEFKRSVSSTGFHSGYVEISDDKYLTDNKYYFSFKIPDRFNLLIIDGDNSGELFKIAMAPSGKVNSYWQVKVANVNELSTISFWDYDLIFLNGAPNLDNNYIQRLKSFLSQGRSLFVTYDGSTDINYFNKNYSELTGVIYDNKINENFTRAGYYSLLSAELDHPIFSVFDFTNNKPPEIKFYTLPKLHIENHAIKLLTFTGDRPALVETNYKSGKVMTFAGPMAPYYSDLTTSSFFVPFISRISEYMTSNISQYDINLYTNQKIKRVLPGNIDLKESVTMLTPDSSEYSLVPTDIDGQLTVKTEPTTDPGIYKLYYNSNEIDCFAVNVPSEESDLSFSDYDQFAKSFKIEEYNILEDGINISETLAELRFGNELWQLFLWLAVILLAIEMLISKSAKLEND